MLEVLLAESNKNKTITMAEMKPNQIGYIVTSPFHPEYLNIPVMRLNTEHFTVMGLTPKQEIWSTPNGLGIRLLEQGESITIKLYNK